MRGSGEPAGKRKEREGGGHWGKEAKISLAKSRKNTSGLTLLLSIAQDSRRNRLLGRAETSAMSGARGKWGWSEQGVNFENLPPYDPGFIGKS